MTFLTLREVAETLKISERTVTRLAGKKKIPGFKLGGQWRFHREHIERWVEKNCGVEESNETRS